MVAFQLLRFEAAADFKMRAVAFNRNGIALILETFCSIMSDLELNGKSMLCLLDRT